MGNPPVRAVVETEETRVRWSRQVAALAVPLAAFAAMSSLAAFEVDRGGAPESAFLGMVATAVLLAVAVLAPAPAIELGVGATLATAGVWALPPGPGRGALVSALLIACLAIAGGRRLARLGPGRASVSVLPGLPAPVELPFAVSVPLAFGFQALFRSDLLLDPRLSPRILVSLLVLPAVAGAALTLLARRHGAERALIAGAAAVVLGPGWNVASALALAALAAGSELAGWEEEGGGTRRLRSLDWREWGWRVLALAVLLAPILRSPMAGLPAAAGGLALWRPRLGALAAGLLAVVSSVWRWEGVPAGFGLTLGLVLLVPTVLALERGRWLLAVCAVLLAFGARPVDGPAVLAAPVALAALAAFRSGPAATAQRVWSGALLLGSALLAAYPWLRAVPWRSWIALLGPEAPVAGVVAWVAVGLRIALRAPPAVRNRVTSKRVGAAVAGALVLVLLAGRPRPDADLLASSQVVEIAAGTPVWSAGFAPRRIRSIAIESSLANSVGLPRGTSVATVRLSGGPGPAEAWTLRLGTDSGEWAARRPDVAAAGPIAPPAWVSWVAGGFFAQRYRATHAMEPRRRFSHLSVERAAGLPPEVEIAIHQVELRR